MKIKILAFLLIIITTFGCNENNKNQAKTNSKSENLNETPQVLGENNDYEVKSFSKSKRYDSDMIADLYNEALEKNAKLKQLNEQIEKIHQTKNDSISAYSKFSQTNSEYWQSANKYISQIQDSVLRKSTLEIFKSIEANYQTKMADYEPKINEINKKEVLLNDQLVLMKLVITESMMINYQLNEKPTTKTLENLIENYDKLIKESEEFTKIRK